MVTGSTMGTTTAFNVEGEAEEWAVDMMEDSIKELLQSLQLLPGFFSIMFSIYVYE